MTVEHFAPSIMIGGQPYEPQGWMWIMGLAAAGDKWAIDEMKKGDILDQIEKWRRQKLIDSLEEKIRYHEEKLFDLMIKKKALSDV